MSPPTRPPLPPQVAKILQAAYCKLVEELHQWQQTDCIDPGLPIRFRISLDCDFPEGRMYGIGEAADFPRRTAWARVLGDDLGVDTKGASQDGDGNP